MGGLIADPAVQYGEIDPDSTEGFGSVAAGSAAKQLLLKHAALHPPELMALRASPRIEEASEALDLEEVQRVAKPAGEVEGASVRGEKDRNPDGWVVTYIFRRESGRSAPGAVPYKRLPLSREEYDTRRAALLRGERLTAAGGGEEAEESPRERALAEEVERLREQLEGAQDPEPYEGYSEATVPDVRKYLKGVDDQGEDSIVRVQALVDYEGRHKDRDTVKVAAEKRLEELREAQKQPVEE